MTGQFPTNSTLPVAPAFTRPRQTASSGGEGGNASGNTPLGEQAARSMRRGT